MAAANWWVESLGFLECHAAYCDILISSTPAFKLQTHSRTGTLHEQVTKSRFLRALVVVSEGSAWSYHGVRSIWRPLDLSNIASASKRRPLTLNIGNIPIAPWSPNRWFCSRLTLLMLLLKWGYHFCSLSSRDVTAIDRNISCGHMWSSQSRIMGPSSKGITFGGRLQAAVQSTESSSTNQTRLDSQANRGANDSGPTICMSMVQNDCSTSIGRLATKSSHDCW